MKTTLPLLLATALAGSTLPLSAETTAQAVPGKPGFVTSPYAPQAGAIDVRGRKKGAEVKDPYTGRTFVLAEDQPDGRTAPKPYDAKTNHHRLVLSGPAGWESAPRERSHPSRIGFTKPGSTLQFFVEPRNGELAAEAYAAAARAAAETARATGPFYTVSLHSKLKLEASYFIAKDAEVATFHSYFLFGDGRDTWQGEFHGTPAEWSEALRSLLTTEVGAYAEAGSPAAPVTATVP